MEDSILFKFSPVCLFFLKTRPFLREYASVRHTVADKAMMILAPTVIVTVIQAILTFEDRALTPPVGTLVGEKLVSNNYRDNNFNIALNCYM